MMKADYSRLRDFRHMLFDFDGTIGDSNAAYGDYCLRLFRENGIPFEGGFDEALKTAHFDPMCHLLAERLNGAVSEEEIRRDFDRYLLSFYTNEVLPMPGAPEYVRELQRQGIRKCVVTASPCRHIEPALSRLGLSECFEYIVSPEMTGGLDKSHPDMFLRAMELMGNENAAGWCLFDDSVTAVKTARALGIFTVGVYDPTDETQKEQMQEVCDLFLPDFTVLSL